MDALKTTLHTLVRGDQLWLELKLTAINLDEVDAVLARQQAQ